MHTVCTQRSLVFRKQERGVHPRAYLAWRRFMQALNTINLSSLIDALVARLSSSTLVVQAFWSPSTTD
ncbi:hypothetical protein GCM10008969_58030 [Pseudomonas veronii subsp. inensis]